MLYINNQRVIENIVVYGDDRQFNVFYPVPEKPTFMVDEKGYPVFKFIKYRFPIDRADGKKGGGFVVFATEFTIPDEKMAIIKSKLQEEVNAIANSENISPVPEAKIGTIRYNKGTSRLLFEKNDFIERMFDAGKPSLYGKNVSTFSLELSVEGAALFESALQGKGGFISVVYELYHDAKLPPITVVGTFNADSFYSFVQDINIEERICAEDDYKETLTEIMTKSESKHLTIDPGSAQIEPKVMDQLRSWGQSTLDDAAERLMIEALPVEDPAEARKWYQEEDIEDVRKEITKHRISDFTLHYTEESYIEVNINPNGPLPNITTLIDKEGNPILWEDYAQEVDLNDKFFKQINATVQVNAPFDELPIHSVEVKLMYKGEPMDVIGSEVNGEYQFTKTDDVARFATYIKDDDYNYSYSYQVNYKGAAKIFQSEEIQTNESVLTVNIDDVGILYVQVTPGDIDFKQIKQAQVLMEYEDSSHGVDKISDQFILTESTSEHVFKHIIFSKRNKPYRYKINYKLTDGKEFEGEWQEGNSNRLFINDPFTLSKTVGFRASGDLETEISNIFIDAIYKDEANNYKVSKSLSLHKENPFYDWYIPVIDKDVTTITYNGTILRKDGTQEEIAEVSTDSSTIIVGENIENLLQITVMADLLDFDTLIKLAHVQLHYSDTDNGVDVRKDITFKAGAVVPESWLVKLKDKTKKSYNYKITYYLQDGSKKEVSNEGVTDLTLFLELPVN